MPNNFLYSPPEMDNTNIAPMKPEDIPVEEWGQEDDDYLQWEMSQNCREGWDD